MRSASNTVMLAAAVAGILAVGTLIWRAFQSQPGPDTTIRQTATSSPVPGAGAPVTAPLATTPPPLANTAPPTPPAVTPPPQAADTQPRPPAAPAQPPAPPAEQPAAAAAPSDQRPSFDVVRVEPTGDAVVAGRAPPNATVTILNKGAKIAEVKTDASGAFAAVPPALPPGEHLLTLRVTGAGGEAESDQSVAISVPDRPGAKVVAALTEPSEPTRVLSDPARPPVDGPQVTIRTVEAGQEGAFFASGTAPAGAPVRLYLNGSFVADVKAAANGSWSLRVEKGMAAGHYDVRADLLEAGSAKVAARAEVPFDYPAQAAAVPAPRPAGAPAPQAAAPTAASPPAQPPATPAAQPAAPAPPPSAAQAPPAAPRVPAPAGPASQPSVAAVPSPPPPAAQAEPGVAVVREIQSVTVQRGDSLWRISRRVLGRGVRYTQIYEANTSQIRDPNRIWPGQVLVAPSKSD